MARPVLPIQISRTVPAFEVCVHGRAVSAQSRNRSQLSAWKRRVSDAAATVWAGCVLIGGDLEMRVFHYVETLLGDLDNLNKPIQDALQGVVFMNDSQVRLLRGG